MPKQIWLQKTVLTLWHRVSHLSRLNMPVNQAVRLKVLIAEISNYLRCQVHNKTENHNNASHADKKNGNTISCEYSALEVQH